MTGIAGKAEQALVFLNTHWATDINLPGQKRLALESYARASSVLAFVIGVNPVLAETSKRGIRVD
jgi:hypothetical protein